MLDVEEDDTGETVINGRLWKLGNVMVSIVAQCGSGGVLPQTKFVTCVTKWTHPCINPNGPWFQAFSNGGVAGQSVEDKWSDKHRLVCLLVVH